MQFLLFVIIVALWGDMGKHVYSIVYKVNYVIAKCWFYQDLIDGLA